MKDVEQIFKEQESFALKHNVPIMEDIQLLCDCVKEKSPSSILEIGTAIGYSGLKMLTACQGKLTTLELDEDRMDLAKEFIKESGQSDRVRFILGDACEIVRFLDGKYDFIFLDGPKGHYAEMLPHLKKLLSNNGTLFADDISFKGKTAGNDYPAHKHRTIVNSLRSFIKELNEDKDFQVKTIDKGDGMIIAEKQEKNHD